MLVFYKVDILGKESIANCLIIFENIPQTGGGSGLDLLL